MCHEVLYLTTMCLTKLSILFVYFHIFPLSVMPRLRILIPITMTITILSSFSQAMAIIFQCTPIHYNWDRLNNGRGGHCINITTWGWANGMLNVILDVWLIALPLPEVIKLNLTLRKKLKAMMMFVVGCL
jgi:hypothetical protein